MDEIQITVNKNNEVVITKPAPIPEPEVLVSSLSKLLGFRDNYDKSISDLQDSYDTEMPKLLNQRAENERYITEAIANGAKTDEEIKIERRNNKKS